MKVFFYSCSCFCDLQESFPAAALRLLLHSPPCINASISVSPGVGVMEQQHFCEHVKPGWLL